MTDWKSRIIGQGEENPNELLANPNNWRIHPKVQQDALSGSIETLGWIQQVIVNKHNGHVIDGHLRVALALRTEQKSVPVLYVDLTEAEEAQALLSLDPIAAMAVSDKEKLDFLLKQIHTEDENVQKFLNLLEQQNNLGENYSRKIEAPEYIPSKTKPELQELFDNSKTAQLIENINNASGITDEEKDFLKIASQRHTILYFNKIADYYAQANAEMQALMEENALVIIDFNQAISLGFITLTKSIAKLMEEEYGPD